MHHIFIAQARPAIQTLRECNVSDAIIACVLCDVRAAAIAEERLRVETLAKLNVPNYPTWVKMRDALNGDALPSQNQTET